jgi:hypothetical protein
MPDIPTPLVVNVDNYVRAETSKHFEGMLARAGGLNRFAHGRRPTPLDQQRIVRMNRDTLYSSALVDISEGATITLPDAGLRYLSVTVINQTTTRPRFSTVAARSNSRPTSTTHRSLRWLRGYSSTGLTRPISRSPTDSKTSYSLRPRRFGPTSTRSTTPSLSNGHIGCSSNSAVVSPTRPGATDAATKSVRPDTCWPRRSAGAACPSTRSSTKRARRRCRPSINI